MSEWRTGCNTQVLRLCIVLTTATEKLCSSRKNHSRNYFSLSFPPAVYLGVTNLSVYQVRMASLCAQWQPHRHASSYRVIIESLLSEYSAAWCSFHCFPLHAIPHATGVRWLAINPAVGKLEFSLEHLLHYTFILVFLLICFPSLLKRKTCTKIHFQYCKTQWLNLLCCK